ncbi:MAG: helix-turn-helix domain-containing protein [Candidatus Bathyarchaeia archaeon]|nr:helix-turn-helix domain-containing protein [Candidatus Bathyarchaeota archaeon]
MRAKERTVWDELELGLGCGKGFRVLLHLILNPNKAFTKYSLAKLTGLRTPSVDRRLKTLVDLGWVKENKFKPKTYEINLENEIVRELMGFLNKMRRARISF